MVNCHVICKPEIDFRPWMVEFIFFDKKPAFVSEWSHMLPCYDIEDGRQSMHVGADLHDGKSCSVVMLQVKTVFESNIVIGIVAREQGVYDKFILNYGCLKKSVDVGNAPNCRWLQCLPRPRTANDTANGSFVPTNGIQYYFKPIDKK